MTATTPSLISRMSTRLILRHPAHPVLRCGCKKAEAVGDGTEQLGHSVYKEATREILLTQVRLQPPES